MHKDASDSSRTSIEILVAAPARKVDTPVVERERNISYSVSTIESNDAALNQG